MQKHAVLLSVTLSALFLPFITQAQIITDVTKATAARDSLLQLAASTRLELSEKTRFEITAPRMGARRHVVQGFNPAANPNKLPQDRVQRMNIWKQKTVYLRNGQVKETFVAKINGQKILRERRLNGTTTWLSIGRTQDLYSPTAAGSRNFYGTYTRDGYFTWNGTQYALPKPL